MFQLSPDITAIRSMRDGVYMDVNQDFINLFGITHQEVIRRTSCELNLLPDEVQCYGMIRIKNQGNAKK